MKEKGASSSYNDKRMLCKWLQSDMNLMISLQYGNHKYSKY